MIECKTGSSKSEPAKPEDETDDHHCDAQQLDCLGPGHKWTVDRTGCRRSADRTKVSTVKVLKVEAPRATNRGNTPAPAEH